MNMSTPEQVFRTALSLQFRGRLSEAERLYRTLLKSVPDHLDCLQNLGNVCIEQGKLEEARRFFQKALNLKPGSADARNGLGTVLQALGRDQEAAVQFEKAIAAEPTFVEARNNLGNVLQRLRRHDEAIAQYRQALALRPEYPLARANLADALAALQRDGEAVEEYEEALALRPDDPAIHYNLGNALQKLDRPADAVRHYERAIALKPDDAHAHTNLGAALQALNRHGEAIGQYQKALALTPDDANVLWGLGLAELAVGNYEGGWRHHECRWDAPATGLRPRNFPAPAWQGKERLAGRTILLHSDQGFGDTIQFSRYVPLVAAEGAKVVLEVQRPLVPLLASLQGLSELRAQGEALPAFDLHCSLQSLPFALGTRLETIPAGVPYLNPPADAVARWRSRLRPPDGSPRIGIAWAGNPAQRNDRNRSIPLALLRPLLAKTPGIVVLQQELRDGDGEILGALSTIALHEGRFADFAETAALISALDLVITVDSAVAHLSGALGKMLWVLLPYSTDWRWPVDRTDNPWYPTARLFRQPSIGDWASVIRSVAAALDRQTRGPSSAP
jgi:tetratricopeptide (TPR) repeat protein